MKPGKPRRITLLDVMALVVAIAVGLAIPRTFGNFALVHRQVTVGYSIGENSTSSITTTFHEYIDPVTASFYQASIKGRLIYWARHALFWPGPCLAALTWMTLVLVLRQSRRPLRRLARHPGPAAALAVSLAAVATFVRLPELLLALPRKMNWAEWWLEAWFMLPRVAGFAVAVAWVTLALSGRWKQGGGWLDRLGTALGACWIGMAALDLVARWLPFIR